ncbi:MAG: molybdenum ABC transporter ATP-binding protein [Pseudomonadota bacterium]
MTLEVTIRAAGPIALDVDFRVEPGEMLALVGPSGAGKSTVLRTIAGLWQPARARVSVGGETWLDTEQGIVLPSYRRRVGMVFQSYALFPHMSALGNVKTSLLDRPAAERDEEARRLLRLVHLEGQVARRPGELSGGQQQRVAVARALARRPRVLLLDEPFSAVDRRTRETLYQEVRELRNRLDMPVVLVTHDIGEAELLADRMAVISDGHLEHEGTVGEILCDPAALRHLGLRDMGASLSARIVTQDEDGLTRLECQAGPLWLPRVEGPVGTRVRVRVMAHEVLLSREAPTGLSALNILPVTVTGVTPGDGPGMLVELRAGEERLLARITRRSALALELAEGVPCHAIIKSMAVARDHVGRQAD